MGSLTKATFLPKPWVVRVGCCHRQGKVSVILEILSYLHLNGRRLVSVVVVAVIAAVVTAVLLSDSADSYEAEAVVFAGRALPADSSAIDLGPFVSDLETVLALDPIRRQVAEATGVPADDISVTTRLSTDRSNLTVVAEQATPREAEDVATEAARAGLRTLLEQGVARAQLGLEAAESQFLEARAELEKFRGDNATYNPVAEYDIVFETLRSLQLQLLDPTLTAEDREDLSQREPGLEAELDRLTPLQQPYNDLVQAVTTAETSFNQETRQVRTTEAALAGAERGDFVIVTPAEQVSLRDTMVAGMVTAVIVVGLLSVVLFAVVDARIRREQNGVPVDFHSYTAPERTSTGVPNHQRSGSGGPTEPASPMAGRDARDRRAVVPVVSNRLQASRDEEDLEGEQAEPVDDDGAEPGIDEELADLLNDLLRHESPDREGTDDTDFDDTDFDDTDFDETGSLMVGRRLGESDAHDDYRLAEWDDDVSAQSDDRHHEEPAVAAERDRHAEQAGSVNAAQPDNAVSDPKGDESEGADRSKGNI